VQNSSDVYYSTCVKLTIIGNVLINNYCKIYFTHRPHLVLSIFVVVVVCIVVDSNNNNNNIMAYTATFTIITYTSEYNKSAFIFRFVKINGV